MVPRHSDGVFCCNDIKISSITCRSIKVTVVQEKKDKNKSNYLALSAMGTGSMHPDHQVNRKGIPSLLHAGSGKSHLLIVKITNNLLSSAL